MNQLINSINKLSEKELAILKEEIQKGTIENLINQKLKEIREGELNKVCPVCHTPIEEENLTLIFGPKDLRKKANFCALDCLEYFINKIKESKRE